MVYIYLVRLLPNKDSIKISMYVDIYLLFINISTAAAKINFIINILGEKYL